MATTRNIQMQYFNGMDYDTLYPQTLVDNINGVLSIDKGGTGQTTGNSALKKLIDSCTVASISSNSYFPFCTNADNNVANTATADVLYAYIVGRMPSLDIQEYSTTIRSTSGSNSASFSITGSFSPKIVFAVTDKINNRRPYFFCIINNYIAMTSQSLMGISGSLSGSTCSIKITLGSEWNEGDWNGERVRIVYIG